MILHRRHSAMITPIELVWYFRVLKVMLILRFFPIDGLELGLKPQILCFELFDSQIRKLSGSILGYQGYLWNITQRTNGYIFASHTCALFCLTKELDFFHVFSEYPESEF